MGKYLSLYDPYIKAVGIIEVGSIEVKKQIIQNEQKRYNIIFCFDEQDPLKKEEIKKFLSEKEIEFIDVKSENTPLENQVFVITGSLEHYSNRDELIEYIESLGGKVISAISSKVNYLINNDVNSTSTKNKKARELGIKIISENEFMEMIK